MANLVTLSRLLLLLVAVWLFYQPLTTWSFANFFLNIFIFVSDGLDGYIARKRNETSLFGALFDIAGDRITELTLWIVAADIDLVPIWVPLVFIIRGVIVDTIRSSNAVAKASAFAGLALQQPGPALLPEFWGSAGWLLTALTYFFVYLSVVLCIARGLPVIAEFVYTQKHDILRRPGKRQ